MEPVSQALSSERFETGHVARHRLVVQESLNHAPQPGPLRVDRQMALLEQRQPHLLQLGP